MRIPMGRVTRDYLIAHRLSPTQCAPNMFRILGSIDALNEKMGLNFTHHDVNWIYNRHRLSGQGYYLKTRYIEVRLISCLLDSTKGMNKDYLIVFEEWYDGIHCPTRKGTLGRAPKSRSFCSNDNTPVYHQCLPCSLFSLFFTCNLIFFGLHCLY